MAKEFLWCGTPLSAIEIARVFPKTIGLSLAEHGTRCGKPGCRCAKGDLHPTAYLRWRLGGRQFRKYVRKGDLAEVRAVIELRRLERERHLREMEEASVMLAALSRLARHHDGAGRQEGGVR